MLLLQIHDDELLHFNLQVSVKFYCQVWGFNFGEAYPNEQIAPIPLRIRTVILFRSLPEHFSV
jgi:hypothetical protein